MDSLIISVTYQTDHLTVININSHCKNYHDVLQFKYEIENNLFKHRKKYLKRKAYIDINGSQENKVFQIVKDFWYYTFNWEQIVFVNEKFCYLPYL